MIFHVVDDRHRKKRAMIFTTNKAVTTWGHVLHDEDLAHAIVDRILERGRVLTLDGPSLRTKHLGLDDPTSSEALLQPARISGIQAAEFPEPTTGTATLSGAGRPPERCGIAEGSCAADCGEARGPWILYFADTSIFWVEESARTAGSGA